MKLAIQAVVIMEVIVVVGISCSHAIVMSYVTVLETAVMILMTPVLSPVWQAFWVNLFTDNSCVCFIFDQNIQLI